MKGLTQEQVENLGVIVIVCQCHENMEAEKHKREFDFVSVNELAIRNDESVYLELSNGMRFRVEPDGSFQRLDID